MEMSADNKDASEAESSARISSYVVRFGRLGLYEHNNQREQNQRFDQRQT